MLVNLETVMLLHTMYSAAFQTGLTRADVSYAEISTTVPSNNKSNYYAWLGDMGDVREWLGDRVVDEMAGHDYTIKNKTWEKTIAVLREDIEDDTYGLYSPMAENLGFVSRTHRSRLMWQLIIDGESGLSYDGKPFFANDHKTDDGPTQSNLTAGAGPGWYVMDLSRPLKPLIFQMRREMELVSLTKPDDANVFWTKKFLWGVDGRYNGGYGFWQTAHKSKAELNEANLATVRQKMRTLKDAKGQLLAMNPTTLVVGPSLETTAEKLINNMVLANGESNITKGKYKLIVSPYLE
jgi:phage major head subunit gpT-like protein